MGELVFIGLGLFDERDVTLRGLEVAESCDRLFAEFFTSNLRGTSPEALTKLYGRRVEVLSRAEVEESDTLVEAAREARVGLLVPGDPMAATTHVALRLRAHQAGIPTRVVAGVSALTAAAGALGLQVYKFGRTTSLPFPAPGFAPRSPYATVAANRRAGLHTLVILDLQEDHYMTAVEGIAYLLEAEGQEGLGVFREEDVVCVVGRLGGAEPHLRADRVRVLRQEEHGPPLHTLVVPGPLHFLEGEALVAFAGLPESLAADLTAS